VSIPKLNFMKKQLIVVVLLVINLSLFSQGVRFGLYAEPQLTWIKTDFKLMQNDGVRFGFNAGLMSDFYFTKNYAFATGISINNCGGRIVFTDTFHINTPGHINKIEPDHKVIYKFQYICVPIGLKLKTKTLGIMMLTANVGLTPGINVKAIAKSDSILDEKIEDGINLFNLGYHVGGGIEYVLGGTSVISASVIYTNGFTNVIKNPEGKTTLNNLSLRLGLIF
jgi:hypothetical protein